MSCKKEKKKPTLVLSQLRVQLILLQVLFVIGTPEYPGQDASPTQAAVERHPTEPTFGSSLAQPSAQALGCTHLQTLHQH